jgi:putative DNA methylase
LKRHSGYKFTVKVGNPKDVKRVTAGTKLSRANFQCLLSGSPISGDYIKEEAQAGRMGVRMMAVVAESGHGRVYLPPPTEMEEIARKATPTWKPNVVISGSTQYLGVKPYGMEQFSQLFTNRQLVALTTLSDLVHEVRERIIRDAVNAGLQDDANALADGGGGATGYADAVAVYLALAIDKVADYNSALVLWSPTRDQAKTTFSRQALQMAWDFAEVNVFADAAGDIKVSIDGIARTLMHLGFGLAGHSEACDAQSQSMTSNKVVSTDPPYYDNVPYADLSDFFYVWLRHSLSRCRGVWDIDYISDVSQAKALLRDGRLGCYESWS